MIIIHYCDNFFQFGSFNSSDNIENFIKESFRFYDIEIINKVNFDIYVLKLIHNEKFIYIINYNFKILIINITKYYYKNVVVLDYKFDELINHFKPIINPILSYCIKFWELIFINKEYNDILTKSKIFNELFSEYYNSENSFMNIYKQNFPYCSLRLNISYLKSISNVSEALKCADDKYYIGFYYSKYPNPKIITFKNSNTINHNSKYDFRIFNYKIIISKIYKSIMFEEYIIYTLCIPKLLCKQFEQYDVRY